MEFVIVVLPIVSLIIGYYGTILTEERRELRAAVRELSNAQIQFQRQQLLSLQNTLAILYTADQRKLAAQEVNFQ